MNGNILNNVNCKKRQNVKCDRMNGFFGFYDVQSSLRLLIHLLSSLCALEFVVEPAMAGKKELCPN